MPDQLNKQSLINLLIDSPLREPIKINLIDIINNTAEPDLPKVYSTITKELEIFQKATERRMKLAEETIAKLGGAPSTSAPSTETAPATAQQAPSSAALPPLDLPPMPAVNSNPAPSAPAPTSPPAPGLSVPPLDLPPLPQVPSSEPSVAATPTVDTPLPTPTPTLPTTEATPTPTLTPLGGAPMTASSDEDALAEIQKELDSLKTTTANEISSAATPAPSTPVVPPVQQ